MTCAIRRACNTTTNTTGADLIEGEQLQSSTQDQRAESPSSNHDKGSSEEDPDRPSLNTGDRAMDSGTCETSSDDRTCVKCGGVNEPLQTVLCGSCKDPYHSICVGRGGTTLTERWLCSNCDSCFKARLSALLRETFLGDWDAADETAIQRGQATGTQVAHRR